jgi:hypothetical protein
VEISRSRGANLKTENTELELRSRTANLKPCSKHKQLKMEKLSADKFSNAAECMDLVASACN